MDLTSKQAFRKPKVMKYDTADGDVAYFRVISGTERDKWTGEVRAEQNKPEESPCEGIYASLLVRSLCDEHGTRIWDDKDAGDLAANTHSKLLKELFDAALDWNRLTKDAVDDEKKD